jgi:predicted O-methyltransferase YrrM
MFAIHDVADMIDLDLAWWSYGAIDAVEAHLARLDGHARVFEYGAGASTAWLARRAETVTSVEHDPGFAEFLAPLLPPEGVDLRLVPAVQQAEPRTPSNRRGHAGLDFTDYVATIVQAEGAFDLVVVDGRARVACVRAALPRLSPDGVVLLDNANRDEYAAVIDDPSLAVEVLRGATPCLPYPTSTALIRPR